MKTLIILILCLLLASCVSQKGTVSYSNEDFNWKARNYDVHSVYTSSDTLIIKILKTK